MYFFYFSSKKASSLITANHFSKKKIFQTFTCLLWPQNHFVFR